MLPACLGLVTLCGFASGHAAASQLVLPSVQEIAGLSDNNLGIAFLKVKELLSRYSEAPKSFPAVIQFPLPGLGLEQQMFQDIAEFQHYRDNVQRIFTATQSEIQNRGSLEIGAIYDGLVSSACPQEQFASGPAKIEQHAAEIQIFDDLHTLRGVVIKSTVVVAIPPKLDLLIGSISEGTIMMVASKGDCSMSFATAIDLPGAVRADDIAKVQSFIVKGANVNDPDSWGTPLDIAVSKGSDIITRLLLDAGADVEGATSLGMGGERPLHLAAARLRGADTARLLIEHGAKLEAFDATGKTPLIVAILSNNIAVADVFISAGADLQAVDAIYHQTPLHWAAGWGRLEVVKLLLARGALINSKAGLDGKTPLHYASMYGRLEMIAYLVHAGADVNAKDDKGITPLKCSHDKGTEELLKNLGAGG